MCLTVKYPDVTVQLTGRDGNAFAIISAVQGELRRQVSQAAADEYVGAVTRSGSYDELLRYTMTIVNVE